MRRASPIPAAQTRREVNTGWAEWVRQHLDALDWSNADLARVTGLDRSLIGRWLNEGTQPTIDSIRAVCQAFHRDIRQGLIVTGLFTEAEMKIGAPAAPDIRLLTNQELIGEIQRRMVPNGVATQGADIDMISGAEQSGQDVTDIEIDDVNRPTARVD